MDGTFAKRISIAPPSLVLLMGANGAGKSRWTRQHREELPDDFFNREATTNRLGLCPDVAAARAKCLAAGASFGIERVSDRQTEGPNWTRTTRRARIRVSMEIQHRHEFEKIGTQVLPPERFSDKYASPDPEFVNEGRGPESEAIRGLIAGSCCGWEEPPTSGEFYEAMRATAPTERQNVVAATLVAEASNDTLALAYLQGAFTWRQVASVLRRRGACSSRQARYVNLHAGRE